MSVTRHLHIFTQTLPAMETRAIGGAKALLQLGKEGEAETEEATTQNGDEYQHNTGETLDNDITNHNVSDEESMGASSLHIETPEHTNGRIRTRTRSSLPQGDQLANSGPQRQNPLTNDNDDNSNEHDHHDDSTQESSNQLNDAVEAAVLRYVGGTLDNRMDRPYKRRHDMMNIDYQWNFLDDNDTNKRKKHSDIDPELAGLDSEHDQLVQAAIMDARELAKQLGQGAIHEEGALHGLAHHQAQQVLAEIKDGSSRNRDAARNRQMTTHGGQERGREVDGEHTDLKKFTSLDALVDEAAGMACSWYNSIPHETSGPRMFLAQEIAAVDLFIQGYCHLHKLSRREICARIWSNERKKDNFWELLTRVLPYRLRALVYKHVRRQYHVFEVRAKWSKEDDEFLRKLAQTKLGNWKEIGDIMGRMPEDCRDRWRNYVKCGENRLLNKWLLDEEKQLRDAVADIQGSDTDKPINWTVVSEKMNGIRLRIQCRYKWNKLLKRESAHRAASMDPHTKLWLFQKLQSLDFPTVETVDWQYIAQMYQDEHKDARWSSTDFKFGFEKLKNEVKNHRKLPLSEILTRLITDLYAREGQDLPPADFDSKMDSTSLANAAVAAVEDNQQYLWR